MAQAKGGDQEQVFKDGIRHLKPKGRNYAGKDAEESGMQEIILNIRMHWYWLGPLLLSCFGGALFYLVVDVFQGIQDEINEVHFM